MLQADGAAPPAGAGGDTRGAAAGGFARALEVLAANLCAVHAFKPPNVLERHGFADGAPRPDCVEMLLREIFDLLLYEPTTRRFDVRRLPEGAAPALRAHYAARTRGSGSPRRRRV